MTFMFLGLQWFQFVSLRAELGRYSGVTQYIVQQYDEASGENDEAQKNDAFKRLAKLQVDQNAMCQDVFKEIFWSSKAYGLFVVLLSFYFWKVKISCVGNHTKS